MSPVSKAQQKAVHNYVRKKYDRISITVVKGQREIIQNHARAIGQSINAYIVQSVQDRITREQSQV